MVTCYSGTLKINATSPCFKDVDCFVMLEVKNRWNPLPVFRRAKKISEKFYLLKNIYFKLRFAENPISYLDP